jgi:hypothetical protein
MSIGIYLLNAKMEKGCEGEYTNLRMGYRTAFGGGFREFVASGISTL